MSLYRGPGHEVPWNFSKGTEREGLSSSRDHGLSLEWGPRARATPLSPIIGEAEGK